MCVGAWNTGSFCQMLASVRDWHLRADRQACYTTLRTDLASSPASFWLHQAGSAVQNGEIMRCEDGLTGLRGWSRVFAGKNRTPSQLARRLEIMPELWLADVSSELCCHAGKRSVGATAANEHSSRSHMVFQLAITGTNAGTGHNVQGASHCLHDQLASGSLHQFFLVRALTAACACWLLLLFASLLCMLAFPQLQGI